MPDFALFDMELRLVVATVVGMAVGLNRELHGKPIGMRTLGLVSLGAALVSVVTVNHPLIAGHPDALSRVIQGIIQGVMAGIGFIGAGAILRRKDDNEVHNLTTAATVWVTAALGIDGRVLQRYQRPLYALSPDGRLGWSLDFARLARHRPGYGYAGITDPRAHEQRLHRLQ